MTQAEISDRRSFLRRGLALTTCVGGGGALAIQLAAMGEASAQAAPDYKAAVCLFMTGGNDSFNTILPTDSESWGAYHHTRHQAESSIALMEPGAAADVTAPIGSPAWLGGVRPVNLTNTGGRTFALHPLLSRSQALVNSGRMSILANVGALIEPMTRQQYEQKMRRSPSRLFSHNDQQNFWQSFQPEGASRGWAGLMADTFAASNTNSMFTALSTGGNSVWLSGRDVRQYQLGTHGATRIGHSVTDPNLRVALQRVANTQVYGGIDNISHLMQRDVGSIGHRSVIAESNLNAALPPASDSRFGPDSRLFYTNLAGNQVLNPAAQQLQVVARTIAARESLGMRRQVFYVTLSGFDTHDAQNIRHADLILRLDHAIGYFNEVLTSMGMQDQVLTFTASEFGRSFTSNGDGTDHGWGGHHFIMGGPSRGGLLHGEMPTLVRRNLVNNSFDASTQQIASGVLVPTTSVDQLAYSIGKWMGVSTSYLASILPNLGNFNSPTALNT